MPDEHDLTRRDLLFAATFVPLAALTSPAQTGPQGAPLADLPAEKRDSVLRAIDENTAQGLPQGRQFLDRTRRLILEGMFGDPYYGGNGAFAGWDLIRYPGPRPAVDREMQRMDVAPAPYHHSAWGP
jgi:hypothetical protein